MAEKREAELGVHSVHWVGRKYCRWFSESSTEASHSTGLVRQRAFMSKRRMLGLLARGMSSLPVADWLSMNSMLDWPEQSHTSPAITLLYTSSFLPASIFNVYGPPGFRGERVTCHLPSVSAVVRSFCPAIDRVTFSPAFAMPWMRRSRPYCRTILSV